MAYNPFNSNDRDGEVQVFRKLIRLETKFMASEGYYQNDKIASFRQFALSYIEEISRCEQFDAFVPYLAMNYFDRFVSRHGVPKIARSYMENTKLFVMCCLTISWKMRMKSFKVKLFQFQRSLAFDEKDVMRMEFRIIKSLQYEMRSLTPISFSGYFIQLISCPPLRRCLKPQFVYQIIIRAQADIGFTQFRPSIMGASAVLFASLKLFPAKFGQFREIVLKFETINRDELWRCCDAIETRYKDDQTMNSLIEQLRSEELDIDTTSEPGQASLPLLFASVPPGGSTDHILAANQPMEMLPPPTERTELQCALSRMKEVEEEGSVTREKKSARKSPVSTPIDIPVPSGVAVRTSPVSVPIDIPVPVRVAERKLTEKRLETILELEESEAWEVEEAASETKASTSAGPRRVELRLAVNSIMNFELHWTDPEVPRVTVESLIISDLYDTSASPAEWFKRFTGVSGFAAFLYCIFAIIEKRGKSNSSNG
ncbi:cyclin-D4-2-like [Actinidia eriantha]|uniref:cyclin-D4-2-like n=1 Tax=Actinidia eriantha TaxID=165200 RepID=UPI002583D63C|nr:cyclin-D4-2-like [Actinidia eriantha]